MNKIFYPALSALLLFSVTSYAGSPVDDRAKIEAASEQYGKLFDYYMEICGVTQYRPRKGEAGGEYGHTVIYLKGACRDESSPFPKLRMCTAEDKEQGAAVSMDSDYSNVEWTTVSSRNFMMYGDLPADSPLTEKEFEATIQKALSQHIFRGVKLQEYHNAKLRRGESYEHYVARWSVGTNFAVNFARNAYCTRVPMVATKGPKDAMMKTIVDFYNGLNAKARRGEFGYDGVTNNCTHIAHNGLASVGFWPMKDVGWEHPAGLGWLASHVKPNLSVPFNTMLDALVKGAGDSDTFSPARVGSIIGERRGFAKYRWMGEQPGVVMEVIPMHNVKNEVYLPGASPFLLDPSSALAAAMNFSSRNDEMIRFEQTIKVPRLIDLKTNLKYWQKKYASDARIGFDRGSYPDLAPALKSYINSQQADVAEKLKKLEELEHPTAQAPAPTEAATDAK